MLPRASGLHDQNLIHERVSRSPIASRAAVAVLPPTPDSRHRNVLLGAIAGAAAGAVVTAAVCADSDGVCLFSPAVLFPIGGAAAGMIVALLLTPVR